MRRFVNKIFGLSMHSTQLPEHPNPFEFFKQQIMPTYFNRIHEKLIPPACQATAAQNIPWGILGLAVCGVYHPNEMIDIISLWNPGPCFNIKMSSCQYRKSHCGDKTVVRSFYLLNGISYSGKTTSLYWFSPLGCFDDTTVEIIPELTC